MRDVIYQHQEPTDNDDALLSSAALRKGECASEQASERASKQAGRKEGGRADRRTRERVCVRERERKTENKGATAADSTILGT